jgi:predicted DNA-binding transcriptional regulator
MGARSLRIDKSTERAMHDLFQSKAESRIYLYLLRKDGARSTDIVRGTRLHPSTVRELLVRMNKQRMIYREKLKNDHIGKNPYLYRAATPLSLLQRYTQDLEIKLNKIANLSKKSSNATTSVKIQIKEVDE